MDTGNQRKSKSASVWTNYGDFFMALIAVFLILLVFALLKSGTTRVKTDLGKQEELLVKGKNSNKIQEAISKIARKKKATKESLNEIKQLAAALQKREKAVTQLMKEYKRRFATANADHKIILEQDAEIKELKAIQSTLKQKSSERERQLKVRQQEMQEKTQSLEVTVAKLQNQRKERKKRTIVQKDTVSSLNQELNTMTDKFEQGERKLDRKSKKIKNLQSRVKDLSVGASDASKQLSGLRQENQSLKGKLAVMNKKHKQLLNKNSNLVEKFKSLNTKATTQAKQISSLKAEFSRLGGMLAKLGKANGELQGQVVGLQKGLAATKADNQAKATEIGRLKSELKGVRKNFAASMNANVKKRKARKPSSNEVGKVYSGRESIPHDERKSIANDISKALSKRGFDVTVDPTSGTVTLSVNESFYFKRNSSELSDRAKEKLRKIIPVYAKSLLNSRYADRIAGVTITGFASPTFRKRFIDPGSLDEPIAYFYNLHLSVDRAKRVATFIFSKEMGSYPHKELLMQQAMVSGAGYTKPIVAKKANRRPAQCGIYDCRKSRRVEFNFVLKDKVMASNH